MAKDNKKYSNRNGDGKENQGKHNNKQKQAGPPKKQDKATLKIGPPPNPKDKTSIKMLDMDRNGVKKRLSDFRDNDDPTILLTLCKKAISLSVVYKLYDEDGSWKKLARVQHRALSGVVKEQLGKLIANVRNWDVNGKAKHKMMCQKICQEVIGEDAYDKQKDAMCAGFFYRDTNHHDTVRKI